MSSAVDLRFFIIGAQRSGTTLLHSCLDRHPDIAMHRPVRPEPKHFLAEGSERVGVADYDARYFGDTSAPVRGEKGTTYLERPDAAVRILTRFPEARFLVILRDPVERAISNWRFSRANGLETLTADEALTSEAEGRDHHAAGISTSPFGYLRRGLYSRQLDEWAEVAGRDSMLVVTLDDVLGGPALGRIQEFLGVVLSPTVGVDGAVNSSPRSADDGDLADVRARLRSHFADANEELRARWGISFG